MIIFIAVLLLLIIITVGVFVFTAERVSDIFKKRWLNISIASAIVLIGLTIADYASGGFKYAHNMPMWAAVFSTVAIAVSILVSADKLKHGKHCLKFVCRSLMISIIIELFVFNSGAYHLVGKDYENYRIPLENFIATNFDCNNGISLDKGEAVLEIPTLNLPVGTITVDAESSTNPSTNIKISIKDSTNSGSYRENIAEIDVIKNNEKSQTGMCNFSGDVQSLKIKMNVQENEVITIKNIEINRPIAVSFSFVRLFLMLFISTAIYSLVCLKILDLSIIETKALTKGIIWGVTALAIIFLFVLINATRYAQNKDATLKDDFTFESGNQITQEIVDAFEAGQVSLLKEVEPALLELENPYDCSQRTAEEVYCSWDHLLFEGKYYSYYGIAPVVLIFLPYHMITGYYFPSTWAVFLFAVAGIVFLTKFYISFVYKFFSKTPSSLVLMAFIMLQMISGIWLSIMPTNFYEIAQSSGFAAVTSGAFFLMSSNIIGDGKIKNWRVAMASALLSIGVLCRPTLAVYCLASLLFIWAGLKKKMSLYKTTISSSTDDIAVKPKKCIYYAPYLLCALLPFVLIGSCQILYNYARFGSVFDFGIQYSLTINDFTQSEYHTSFVLIGFFNYFINWPKFSETFPYLDVTTIYKLKCNGYYFVASCISIGLFWKALPIFSYTNSVKAYRQSKNINKRLYTLIILLTCIICPFIIVTSIWESGYAGRYSVDFAWQLLMGAFVIMFIRYNNSKNEQMKKFMKKVFAGSLLVSFALFVSSTYYYVLNGGILSSDVKAIVLSFARNFEVR